MSVFFNQAQPRAAQLFLTLLALATGCLAFAFSVFFERHVEKWGANLSGDLSSANLPCIRNTLPACHASIADICSENCCPPGYSCARSPLSGLYCQDRSQTCGDHNWCRDYAFADGLQDGECASHVCSKQSLVLQVAPVTFVLSAVGVLLDVVDIMICVSVPDATFVKSVTNIASSLFKWVAFGIALGAGTREFMGDLEMAQCFNDDGMGALSDAGETFTYFATLQAFSAFFSMCLAPINAYYGGKLFCSYVK